MNEDVLSESCYSSFPQDSLLLFVFAFAFVCLVGGASVSVSVSVYPCTLVSRALRQVDLH